MKQVLINCAAVGGAGFVGALARYLLALALNTAAFPTGTLLINVSGSFLIGWFMAAMQDRLPVDDPLRLAVTVGFLGAYTTFSSLMYETDGFFRDGSFPKAWAYLVGSLLLGLLAARGGWALGQRF